MYRCFHCDQLLALSAELGPVHPQGGAVALSCPDCAWRGALIDPLRCPDCGGLRLREDHRALPSLRRRGDGARVVFPEAGHYPAGSSPPP